MQLSIHNRQRFVKPLGFSKTVMAKQSVEFCGKYRIMAAIYPMSPICEVNDERVEVRDLWPYPRRAGTA